MVILKNTKMPYSVNQIVVYVRNIVLAYSPAWLPGKRILHNNNERQKFVVCDRFFGSTVDEKHSA